MREGAIRALAQGGPGRWAGTAAVPTLREQGFDVVLGNWRGVYGAPGISAAQRAALTDIIVKATKSKAWEESLKSNAWTPALMTGKAFDEFVDQEFSSLRGIMHLAGMV